MIDKCVKDLQENFKEGLEDKCRVGAANVGQPEILSKNAILIQMYRPQRLLFRPPKNLQHPCIGLRIEPVSTSRWYLIAFLISVYSSSPSWIMAPRP